MNNGKFIIYFVLVTLLFPMMEVYSRVDTRLNFVSNIYNSPVIGQGTLVIDVEATSNEECYPTIKLFQDAFQLDELLTAQTLSVTFSDQLFPNSGYCYLEGFDRDRGRIRYVYIYNCGTMTSISTDWLSIVRITIVYTMTSGNSTICWYDGFPNYLVINDDCRNITGVEYPIPFNLKDISLPVTLASFDAFCEKGTINLKWITESEVNNLGFEILRATKPEGSFQNIASYKYDQSLCGKGNSTIHSEYSFCDNSICNGQRYWYKLIDVDTKGNITTHGPISIQANFGGLSSISAIQPVEFQLYQNYPNPFNPRTTLRFDIPATEQGMVNAKLLIFNSLGHLVKTIYDGKTGTGSFEVEWDGRTENGLPAPSGIYLATLQSTGFNQSVRMTLLK
jgi:FlgD Ig-like domain